MMLNAAVAIAAYDPSTNNYMVEESTGTNGVEWVHSYFINKPLSETSRLYEELAKIVGTTNMEDAQ